MPNEKPPDRPSNTADQETSEFGGNGHSRRVPAERKRKSALARVVAPVVGLVVLVGALVGVKACQIGKLMAFGKEAAKQGPPPEIVGTAKSETQSWESTLTAVGSVASLQGVGLSNDMAGTVTKINFDSGQIVKEGQILVELDTSVERAQLASAIARRELAQTVADRTRSLVAKGAIAQAQLDTDDANLKAGVTDVEGIQAQIVRKSIRAPFGGRLGIRNVNLGQYLNPGTVVTVLESLDGVYVDFSLPQQRLAEIKVGMPVRFDVTADARQSQQSDGGVVVESFQGAIAAVDPAVDQTTRTIKLRATATHVGDKLRPGMFANVAVELPKRGDVTIVPQTAIVHASYGDSVFVVEEKKADSPGMTQTPDGKPVKNARQQFVKLGDTRGDFISVLDGIGPGQEVVVAGAFKLKNNAPVVVDNAVKTDPKLNPRPENR